MKLQINEFAEMKYVRVEKKIKTEGQKLNPVIEI